MKDVTNELFISVHMVKEKNLIEEIQYKIKYGIFGLFYLLLKNQDINLWVEVICHNYSAPSVPGIHLRTPIHQHMEERPFLYSNQ